MEIEEAEANTQLGGDGLIAVEGVHGAVGGGVTEPGNAEDAGGLDYLPGTQGFEGPGQVLPLIEAVAS
jgi:hypothetical protein